MSFPILIERIRSLMTWEWGEQSRICKEAGFSPTMLNNIWNGSVPSAENLKRLAIVLGTSTDYLVGLTDDPKPSHRRAEDERQA